MKAIATILISLTLSSSALAKPKAAFQVGFVQGNHLIHYDYKLSQKAATELAEAMNELKADGGAKHFVVIVPEAAK